VNEKVEVDKDKVDKVKEELKIEDKRLHKKIGRQLALRVSAPVEESARPITWNDRKGWR